MKQLSKYIAIFIMISFIFQLVPVWAAEEQPVNVYSGTADAVALVNNMDFRDVELQGKNYWARKAIYDMAALSIIKGYGEKRFNTNTSVTKIEALALIYRAVGKEAEAQQAAQIIEQQRAQEERRINATAVWADGYLQLAANDGLITPQQLQDALAYDQQELDPAYDFIKTAPAQRQEVGEWTAKALALPPVYNQQTIFNSFRDWKQADPLKVPYLEAVLKEKIMNGTTDGFLHPTHGIRRDEMAQTLKNAEKFILSQQGLTQNHGYIEEITYNTQAQMSENIITKVIKVRNEDGALDHIMVQSKQHSQSMIETSGDSTSVSQKEIVVLGKGMPGHSNLLHQGDEIRYIADGDNTVQYVRVLSSNNKTVNDTGKVVDIDYEKRSVTLEKDDGQTITYRVSGNADFIVNGKKTTFEAILPEAPVELTLRNKLAVKVEVKAQEGAMDKNEVTGIVEDINPSLGYISLYDETGKKSFNLLRIYNFLNPSFVEVIRGGYPASINDVQPGDSVFLKLDEDGYVVEIASSPNYTVKYATIMTKNPRSILVQYEDGIQQLLDIPEDILITQDKRNVSYSAVRPGQKVRLVMHQTDAFTSLKELTVETGEYRITNIYKADLYYYEPINNQIVVNHLTQLERGQWTLTGHRGLTPLVLTEDISIYADNRQIRLEDINDYYTDSEAYIAVQRDLGGVEKAVFISLRKVDEPEKRYTDTIKTLTPGIKEFKMGRQYETFKYSDSTIIVKDGKMISGNNLDINDQAYVVANRSYDMGEYNAAVVMVEDTTTSEDAVIVYRGRIKSINENQDFTVQSFSQFNGSRWKYYNTPKTFMLTHDTRILDENGVVNNRSFNEYSDKEYNGKVVSIVAKGLEVLMISEAPYGEYNFQGTVSLKYGQTIDNNISLRKVKQYDRAAGKWKEVDDGEITLREDTIILKDGNLASKEDIKRGSTIKVIKKDADTAGEALIIIIEE